MNTGWKNLRHDPHSAANRSDVFIAEDRGAFGYLLVSIFFAWHDERESRLKAETAFINEQKVVNDALANMRQRTQSNLSPSNETARAEHLKRLHESLKHDIDRYGVILLRLNADGRIGDVGSPQYKIDADSLWRFDGVLSLDMKNHYPDYFARKKLIEERLSKHDKESGRVIDEIKSSLSNSLPSDWRTEITIGYFDKCQGRSGIQYQSSVSGHSYSFHGGGSSGSGPGSTDMASKFEAFQSLKVTSETDSECASLARDSAAIMKAVESLRDEAKRLLEMMSLEGNCEFVK